MAQTEMIGTMPPTPTRPWHSWPLFKQLRQSVGLQRGMLIAGLILVALFVLTALFAPVLAPYGYAQLSDEHGKFVSLEAPSAAHPLGTTIAGYDVLSRVIW